MEQETELYEAYDYVLTALNNAHLRVIWHKTHIMPFRDTIGLILHDVQASVLGALTLEPTVLDPRLVVLKGNTDSSSSSQASLAPPKVSKTPYNKGQKREITESTDDIDKASLPVPKRIDFGVAITSLSKEIARSREAKLSYESN